MYRKFLCLTVLLFTIYTGGVYVQANTSLSNLANPTSINQFLSLNANNTLDFGNGPFKWRSFFIENGTYLKDILASHSPRTGNFFYRAIDN